ncbi:hypothetical protein BVY04_00780 [bacterium M21]|nr:hypothetical protein BVY04_00780 [bacterium M21]
MAGIEVNSSEETSFWSRQVGAMRLQKPAIVPSGTSITKVVMILQDKHYGAALVADEKNQLLGIITIHDLMLEFVGSSVSGDAPVDLIMTKDPITVPPEMSLLEAAAVLHKKGFLHLPVVDRKQKIRGILTARRVMNFVAENLPADVLNLPPDSQITATQKAGG